jgi:hypothetical protein
MRGPEAKKGMIIFGLIAAIFLICAIIAFQATGPLGIEERFSSAAGSFPEVHGAEEDSIAGFFLEGNVLQYIIIVGVLVAACIILYRKYRV